MFDYRRVDLYKILFFGAPSETFLQLLDWIFEMFHCRDPNVKGRLEGWYGTCTPFT